MNEFGRTFRRTCGGWGRAALGAALGLTMLLTTGEAVGAQATRTWVSGVGDDVNPCSRTAPCKTWAGTISKTAAGGEISALDHGGFGAVTITKAMTLNGVAVMAGILAAGTNGVVVYAGVNDVVVLRGLTIDGAGSGVDGVRFLAGSALIVEDTTIAGFTGHGIEFRPTANAELFVARADVRQNGGTGIRVGTGTGAVGAAVTATVSDTQLSSNAVGLEARDNARVAVLDSAAGGNGTAGFRARPDAGTAELLLESTSVVANGVGVQAGGGGSAQAATVRLSNAYVVENLTGVSVVAGNPLWTIVSFGNNQIFGNNVDGAATSTVAQQ